jgi:membrane associated rhomboid family serine protease
MLRLHRPDPEYLSSERSQQNFKLALKLSVALLALIWLAHLANVFLDYRLLSLGVDPRHLSGLAGVLFAPLLHVGLLHLLSNSLPLVIASTGMLYVYPNSAIRALPIIYMGTGLLVWWFGRPTVHVGASGLVFGMLAYVFVSGVARLDTRGIAWSVLVWFLYGGMVRGLLPADTPVSWESHLAGALLGAFMAILFRNWDRPPRQRYSWEDEED